MIGIGILSVILIVFFLTIFFKEPCTQLDCFGKFELTLEEGVIVPSQTTVQVSHSGMDEPETYCIPRSMNQTSPPFSVSNVSKGYQITTLLFIELDSTASIEEFKEKYGGSFTYEVNFFSGCGEESGTLLYTVNGTHSFDEYNFGWPNGESCTPVCYSATIQRNLSVDLR
jgi:hypothetical protein